MVTSRESRAGREPGPGLLGPQEGSAAEMWAYNPNELTRWMTDRVEEARAEARADALAREARGAPEQTIRQERIPALRVRFGYVLIRLGTRLVA